MAEGRQTSTAVTNRIRCWWALMQANYMVLFVFVLIAYFPRLLLSYLVFALGQFLRFGARLVGVECGRPVANRRILLITDYLPPQTHGIAIRCQAYAKELRAQGHHVVVFATAYDAAKETSFDHPNIPSVPNPFNLKNRIGYTAGVKLAWYLGAHTWDVVHLVYPSLIGGFVLSCCAWREIPTYCSHHVEMEIFSTHAPYPLDRIGLALYNLVTKGPAVHWGTLNAAPTLCFAKAHCGTRYEDRLRAVPSGTHNIFTPKFHSDEDRREVRASRFGVTDDSVKVTLMVQRLSKEKGTERVFPVFSQMKGGHGVPGVLVIAGDGPSRAALEEEARDRGVAAVFLGNVPHHDLPKLYRAADCFVTMSMSETYGLTCLEAQMCGCPAVMPYCEVFNEIWSHRVPKEWRYNLESVNELAAAIAFAQASGRQFLEEHPVRQTWQDASMELLGQYEECIELNRVRKHRHTRRVQMCAQATRVIGLLSLATYVAS